MVLPEGWIELYDEGSGQNYYYNETTGVTSWDIPTNTVGETSNEEKNQNTSPNSTSEWNMEQTDNGEVYYANIVTGEVSWDPPAGWKMNRDDLEKVAVVELSPSEMPENWEEVQGEMEDEVYYFNNVTQESQWDKPQCLELLEKQELDAQARKFSRDEEDSDEDDDDSSGSDDSSITQSVIDSTDNQEKDIYSTINDPKVCPTVEELSKLVESYSIETYAETHFNYERKGLLRSKSAVDKLMSWGAEPLTSSLLIFDEIDHDFEFNDRCIEMFRYVQAFMRDHRGGRSTVELALEIFARLFHVSNQSNQLTDEILAQLCKQTTNNPSIDSNDRGWALMLLILCSFPPSETFLPYLMSYCAFTASEDVPGRSAAFAHKAVIACARSHCLGRRIDPPSPMEIEAVVKGFPISVRISFIDDKYLYMDVKSWTTCGELSDAITEKLKIGDDRSYGLFEVEKRSMQKPTYNLLNRDVRVLDIEGSWYATQSEAFKRANEFNSTEGTGIEMYFLFKIAYFFPSEETEDDAAGVELAYIQARSDILSSRYPTTGRCAYLLAALQLQEELGDFYRSSVTGNNIPIHAENADAEEEVTALSDDAYLPLSFLNKYLHTDHLIGNIEVMEEEKDDNHKKLLQVRSEVLRRYRKLRGFTRLDAQLTYLDYVKSLRVYGSVFFFVESQNNKAYPPEVMLGINGRNVVVTNPTTHEYLSVIDIADLISVSYSAKNFIMVMAGEEDNQQEKFYFITNQGHEINHYVQRYIDEESAKTIDD